jgi:4-diphosphocytidyl-2-C-methyl-D-erythritol kinase
LKAPAKLNLTLEVLARRVDGYHGIRSVMVPLGLADELSIEPSAAFSFECDDAELAGERNLAAAAVRALFDDPPAVRVRLTKRIPVQAGLGGGSSDAAAVLRAAQSGAFGAVPRRDWLQIARALGSDVPFFLAGTGALVEGTGERVTPAGAIPPWHVLIVKPPVAVSTADAYRELDRRERPQRPRSASVSLALLEALQRGEFDSVERLMCNDFHDPIASSAPEIADASEALRAAGASNAMLCGSGSCVFTLATDGAAIERILKRLTLAASFERYTTQFAATPEWRS